jgi:hypothetical protein
VWSYGGRGKKGCAPKRSEKVVDGIYEGLLYLHIRVLLDMQQMSIEVFKNVKLQVLTFRNGKKPYQCNSIPMGSSY